MREAVVMEAYVLEPRASAAVGQVGIHRREDLTGCHRDHWEPASEQEEETVFHRVLGHGPSGRHLA